MIHHKKLNNVKYQESKDLMSKIALGRDRGFVNSNATKIQLLKCLKIKVLEEAEWPMN